MGCWLLPIYCIACYCRQTALSNDKLHQTRRLTIRRIARFVNRHAKSVATDAWHIFVIRLHCAVQRDICRGAIAIFLLESVFHRLAASFAFQTVRHRLCLMLVGRLRLQQLCIPRQRNFATPYVSSRIILLHSYSAHIFSSPLPTQPDRRRQKQQQQQQFGDRS
jgi:hypothetical protein